MTLYMVVEPASSNGRGACPGMAVASDKNLGSCSVAIMKVEVGHDTGYMSVKRDVEAPPGSGRPVIGARETGQGRPQLLSPTRWSTPPVSAFTTCLQLRKKVKAALGPI